MHKGIRKVLVTGGAGFIGSEFVRHSIDKGYKVVVVDKLTYAGDLLRLKDVAGRYVFYKIDICNKAKLADVVDKEKPDAIIHFAAETHVDRSIQEVGAFIRTNVIGTQNLIDISRKYGINRFLHISTDEVYGESQSGRFLETAPIKPNNPYSATKASAEMLVRAAIRTYNFPAIIIRPANNYGPWQYPEKLIPVVIFKAMHNQPVPVYGRGKQIREWLYVSDCAEAIEILLEKGKIGEIYNIGSYFDRENINTVKTILKLLDKPENLIQFVQDRAGHDFRYSVNCAKIKRLGWRAKTAIGEGMRKTVAWYMENMKWMEDKKRFLERYWKKVYKI